ncbi:hypothetical protein [Methanolobus sp.]|nr:hypothetical protein [Methanolobus sp.]
MAAKGWTSILVKESTRDKIKREADVAGMKMYALIDQRFPEKTN